MSDDGPGVPAVGRFEALLAAVLAAAALAAALAGSRWWEPLAVAAPAVLVAGLVQPVLRRRVLSSRARERGAGPRQDTRPARALATRHTGERTGAADQRAARPSEVLALAGRARPVERA